jgi:hypothetical protein
MLCQDLKDKPSPLFDAFIKMGDPDYYQSIRETFHSLLTMPMRSVKKTCERSFFCFGASKAMEQNNNGRGQTKRTSIIAHSQKRKC